MVLVQYVGIWLGATNRSCTQWYQSCLLDYRHVATTSHELCKFLILSCWSEHYSFPPSPNFILDAFYLPKSFWLICIMQSWTIYYDISFQLSQISMTHSKISCWVSCSRSCFIMCKCMLQRLNISSGLYCKAYFWKYLSDTNAGQFFSHQCSSKSMPQHIIHCLTASSCKVSRHCVCAR